MLERGAPDRTGSRLDAHQQRSTGQGKLHAPSPDHARARVQTFHLCLRELSGRLPGISDAHEPDGFRRTSGDDVFLIEHLDTLDPG